MTIKSKKHVFNIAYLSTFIMYFRLTPLSAETQPLVILLLVPISLLLMCGSRLVVKKEDRFLLVFFVILVLYLIPTFFINGDYGSILNYALRLLIMPLAYLLFLKDVKYLDIKAVRIAVYGLFIIALIEWLHIPILYNMMMRIYNRFFGRYSEMAGTRGICILTVEPSYFVFFAILLIYSLDFLVMQKKAQKRESIFLKMLVIFMCLLTKSGLVYLFVAIYIVQYASKMIKDKYLKVAILIIVTLLFVAFFKIISNEMTYNSNRFFEIVNNIFAAKGIKNAIFYSDASGGFRLLINIVYLLSIFIYPFGMGYGGIRYKWENIANVFHIDLWKNGHFFYNISPNAALDAQAYIPNLVGTIGIFVVFYIVFLYSNNKLKDRWLRACIVFTLTLFLWGLQSNFFNPVFWILIGFIKCNSQANNQQYMRYLRRI